MKTKATPDSINSFRTEGKMVGATLATLSRAAAVVSTKKRGKKNSSSAIDETAMLVNDSDNKNSSNNKTIKGRPGPSPGSISRYDSSLGLLTRKFTNLIQVRFSCRIKKISSIF